mmetsp:Transcript_23717/g.66607  ORF Transcript_23717/g.66607 Transcript_23717/m.66607 type:complete len:94 (+) Transcript_23717:318-599(+)
MSANVNMDTVAPINKPPTCAAKSISGRKLVAMMVATAKLAEATVMFLSLVCRGSVWFQVISRKTSQAPMIPQSAPDEPTLRWLGDAMQLASAE